LSVKIRLKRMGSKKRPFYRIVATDSRMPRDGRFIETLGYYDPMSNPVNVNIREDLVFKWMERGARPSDNTERILRNSGVLKKWSLLKQGVPRDQIETKYEELKASETPPMDGVEREKKRAAKAAADAQSEAAEGDTGAGEAEASQESEAKPESAGTGEGEKQQEAGEAEAKPEADTGDK
jgi:small subunit ribosomal protein S16